MSLRKSSLMSLLLLFLVNISGAQSAGFSSHARDRVLRTVDEQDRIILRGDVHPLARRDDEIGPVPPGYRMERMVLVLKPDSEQKAALDELLAGQHDPTSPYYHQWLTPQSYGERFGVSEDDLAQVTNWLERHGLYIEAIPPSRTAILFSGTAAQVES